MPIKTTDVAVANLSTAEKYFNHFEAEMHADNTGNNRVGVLDKIPGVWNSGTLRFDQRGIAYFENAVIGTTYFFRFRVIDKYGNAGVWSVFISEVAGDTIAPNPTYLPTTKVSFGGLTVLANPQTPPSDTDHYEFIWNTTNFAPLTSDPPNAPDSKDGTAFILMIFNPAETAYVWIRAVDTSGNRQAWTSLGGFSHDGKKLAPFLVQNSDFELGDVSWAKDTTNFSIVNDPTNAYNGNWVGKYVGTAISAMRNDARIAVQPGTRILARCLIKRTVGDGNCRVRISWKNSSNIELSTSPGNLVTSSTYAESTIVASAPAGAAFAGIECEASATISTTAFFDQFSAAYYPKAVEVVYGDGSTVESLKPAEVGAQVATGKSLDIFTDGTTRKARTAAHSSYRPLGNYLTATDAGVTVTVNIAAGTNRIGGTDVSVNSGSIIGLSFNTLYYIYFDDASFAGGSVIYNATVIKEMALAGEGRFFWGSIRTPKDGAVNTIGNNDGGVGAQIGGHIFRRPSTETVAGLGTTIGAGQGKDSDWATSVSRSTGAANITLQNTIITLSTFGLGVLDDDRFYRNVRLKVKGSVTIFNETDVPAANSTASIDYSTDNGTNWTAIRSQVAPNAALAEQVDTVSLVDGTNPNLVQVRVRALGHAGGINNDGSLSSVMFEAELEADF